MSSNPEHRRRALKAWETRRLKKKVEKGDIIIDHAKMLAEAIGTLDGIKIVNPGLLHYTSPQPCREEGEYWDIYFTLKSPTPAAWKSLEHILDLVREVGGGTEIKTEVWCPYTDGGIIFGISGRTTFDPLNMERLL